jgi:hypothetical protein
MIKRTTKKADVAREVAHVSQTLKEERERLEEGRHRRAWRGIQEALGAGRLEAIAAGVRYCHRHHQVPPHWFVASVAQLVAETLNPKKRKQGRPKAPADAALHLTRWEVIELLKDNGRGFDDAIAEAVEILADKPERGGEDALKRSHKKVRAWIRKGDFSRYAPFHPPE